MNRRLGIILVVAGVVGLIASSLVYRVVVGLQTGKEQQTQIVVAAVNMGLAETITDRHVKLVSWPANSVPPGVVKSLPDAEGRVVRSSIVAGEPLLDAKLAPQLSGKGGIMPMLVPEGQRGVTFKVPDAIKESGFILPNSRVDVLVSMTRAGGEKISKIVLQDVLVLAAGQTVEIRDNKPVSVTTVTVALSPDQTERLALAQNEGRLMLVTRNLKDTQIVQTRGVTIATLLADAPVAARPSSSGQSGPKPKPAPVTAVLPPPRIETHVVSVLRGSKTTDQVFVRDRSQEWVDKHDDKR